MNKLVVMYSLLNLSLFSFAACSDVANLAKTKEEGKNIAYQEDAKEMDVDDQLVSKNEENLKDEITDFDENGEPLDQEMKESFVFEGN